MSRYLDQRKETSRWLVVIAIAAIIFRRHVASLKACLVSDIRRVHMLGSDSLETFSHLIGRYQNGR